MKHARGRDSMVAPPLSIRSSACVVRRSSHAGLVEISWLRARNGRCSVPGGSKAHSKGKTAARGHGRSGDDLVRGLQRSSTGRSRRRRSRARSGGACRCQRASRFCDTCVSRDRYSFRGSCCLRFTSVFCDGCRGQCRRRRATSRAGCGECAAAETPRRKADSETPAAPRGQFARAR